MARGRTLELAAIGVEEALADLRIVEAGLLDRSQKPLARRDDWEPDVEVVIFPPAVPRHTSRRPPRGPDAQPFPTMRFIADAKGTGPSS